MLNQDPNIYARAVAYYEKTTKKKLEPAIAGLTSLEALKETIESNQKDFAVFRERRDKIFAVLCACLGPVQQVGHLTGGGSALGFSPSSLVFGAVSLLMGAVKGVAGDYDAIIWLFERLKDFTIRLEVYDREVISPELGQKLAETIATLIEIFALSRKVIKEGSTRRFTRNIFLGEDPKIQDAMRKLEQLTESESRLVSAETLTTVKNSDRKLDALFTTVSAIRDTTMLINGALEAETQESKSTNYRQHIRKILEPSTSALDLYSQIERSRVLHTGDWIREEPLFNRWVNKQIPLLYISGHPGAGKTYIASNIISFLSEHISPDIHPTHQSSVAYFFFRDSSLETQMFDRALRTVAYELSRRDPIYAKYIASSVDSTEVRSLESIWRNLFAIYFLQDNDMDSNIYLVLDGMDEADRASREEFLFLLKDLNLKHSRIRILMLGRAHVIEDLEYAELELPTIDVNKNKNSEDIEQYIKSCVYESNKSPFLKRCASKALKDEVIEKLSQRAQGMFIWVDLMLKGVLRKNTETLIRAALDDAPQGLVEMIRHVLRGLSLDLKDDIDEAEDLNILISWVTCSPRPLSLSELKAVLEFTCPDRGDRSISMLEWQLRIKFGSLFMLEREDGLATDDLYGIPIDASKNAESGNNFCSNPKTTKVSFSHASIGEFFRNEIRPYATAGEKFPTIGSDFNSAKVSVLKVCLDFICSKLTPEQFKRAYDVQPFIWTFWNTFLGSVDITKTNIDDKLFIGKALVKLLIVDTLSLSVVVLFNATGDICRTRNLFSQANLTIFETWVTNLDVFKSLSKKEKEWIQSTSGKRLELFSPWISRIGNKWLQSIDNWSNTGCVQAIHLYLCLLKGVPESKDFLLTKEEIEEAADWLGFEQNAVWHFLLGRTFRRSNHFETAIQHFQTAIQLNPLLLSADLEQSICHQKLGSQEKAIELNQKVIELYNLNEDPYYLNEDCHPTENILHRPLERIAMCLDELGKKKEALHAYEKAFKKYNGCYECFSGLLELHYHEHNYDKTIKLIRGFNKEIQEDGHTYRFNWLNICNSPGFKDNIHQCVLDTTMRRREELPIIVDMYQNAITAAPKHWTSVEANWLQSKLALLHSNCSYHPERAEEIWENIIEKYRSIKDETRCAQLKKDVRKSFALHCLRRSVEFGKNTAEAKRYGAVIKRIVQQRAHFQTAIFDPTLSAALGGWHKFIGQEEEAQSLFRTQINESLRMLSDDDPLNDKDAYAILKHVLSLADDDENFVAVIVKLLELNKDQDSHVKTSGECGDEGQGQEGGIGSEERETDFLILGICSLCRREARFDLAMCKYCDDIGFCPDCFLLIKAGNTFCSPKHSWMVVKGIPRAVFQSASVDTIWAKDQRISVDEWKRRLAEKWDIKL